MSIPVDGPHLCGRPVIFLLEVVMEGYCASCRFFRNPIMCACCGSSDVQLRWVGGESGDSWAWCWVMVAVFVCFRVCVYVESGFKGKIMVGDLVVLMALDVVEAGFYGEEFG